MILFWTTNINLTFQLHINCLLSDDTEKEQHTVISAATAALCRGSKSDLKPVMRKERQKLEAI